VSYADLLVYAPLIQRLQLENDRAGYVEQRHLARMWFETSLQNCWRGNRLISYTSPKTMSWYVFLNRDVWLQAQFDAGYLQVDERVIEVNAERAIAYVYDAALGAPAGDEKAQNEYRKLANKYFREPNQLMKCRVFGINSLGTGLADYATMVIDFSRRDTRL
jgi:hypothetical protein